MRSQRRYNKRTVAGWGDAVVLVGKGRTQCGARCGARVSVRSVGCGASDREVIVWISEVIVRITTERLTMAP